MLLSGVLSDFKRFRSILQNSTTCEAKDDDKTALFASCLHDS